MINGTRGRISALNPAQRSVTVALDDQHRTVTLPAESLDAGHLDHGYAITTHKTQGATTARAFMLGCADMHRE